MKLKRYKRVNNTEIVHAWHILESRGLRKEAQSAIDRPKSQTCLCLSELCEVPLSWILFKYEKKRKNSTRENSSTILVGIPIPTDRQEKQQVLLRLPLLLLVVVLILAFLHVLVAVRNLIFRR